MSIMRSKPFWITGGAIALVLLVASILVLVKGLRGADQARTARNRARRDLERYYAQDPFPTPENIERARQNLAQTEDWLERLFDILSQGQMPTPELSPAGFIQRLNARINELRRESPRVTGALVADADFNFGFDAYLGADAALPEPEHVGRLARQLSIVEMMVELIYHTDVMRLSTISRERFDIPRDEARTARRPTGRMVGVRTPDTDDSDTALYSRERIRLGLRLRPAALSLLLNRLAQMQPVMVVNDVSIRKSETDLRPVRPEAAPARPAARTAPTPFRFPGMTEDDTAERPDRAPATAEDGPLPRESRLVSGPEVDPPLDVNLEIFVYQFKGE